MLKNKIAVILVIVILLSIIGGLMVLYGGAYNISAADEHFPITLWAIENMRDGSIRKHAKSEEPPPDLKSPENVMSGFKLFDKHCIVCHGAPGIESEAFAEGLYPTAPALAKEIDEWTIKELFWITKHGIKMTGMPAFGDIMQDEAIWKITAFLDTLPDLGYYGYLELRDSAKTR